MARYISNKKVNLKTANNLKDFDSIGDAVWNFLSLVYQSGCCSNHLSLKDKWSHNEQSSQ